MKSLLYSSCLRKKRYDTFELASRVAEERMCAGKVTIFVYACGYCSGVHLTKARFVDLDEEVLEDLLGWEKAA